MHGQDNSHMHCHNNSHCGLQAEIFTAVLAAVFEDSGGTSLEAARRVCNASGIVQGTEALGEQAAAVPALQHAPQILIVEGAQAAAPGLASKHGVAKRRLALEQRQGAGTSNEDANASDFVSSTQVRT